MVEKVPMTPGGALKLREDKTLTIAEICQMLQISRATFYNYTKQP